MHQIQPHSLGDVEDRKTKIGEGVFGKCKNKIYRGQIVAVKYFKSHSRYSAVDHEENFFMRFDHPGTSTRLTKMHAKVPTCFNFFNFHPVSTKFPINIEHIILTNLLFFVFRIATFLAGK